MTITLHKKLLAGILGGSLALAACAGSTPIASPASEAPADPAPTPAPVGAGASATIGDSSLGEILVGAEGLTLYGFTNDAAAASTCYGTCADAWPPVIVDPDWTVAPDLDAGIFATTTRDDGQLQLVAGKWPLYYFAGDVVPGDLKGQGSGEVWFAVGTDGVLLTGLAGDPAAEDTASDDTADDTAAPGGEAGSIVGTATTDLGTVLVDGDGLSLYGFTDDTDGVPTCADGCAEAWPPVTLDALPSDLDPAIFSLVERPDGSMQLRAGMWPLYRFAGDGAPGELNGQGSGGVWFAVAPDGSLIQSADGSADGSGSGGYGS